MKPVKRFNERGRRYEQRREEVKNVERREERREEARIGKVMWRVEMMLKRVVLKNDARICVNMK